MRGLFANLALAIRAELGLVFDTPLTTAHLAALDDLDANAYHVADLTGMEYAVNLRVFYADDGQVADLSPLAGLSSLTTLVLSYNLITDLSPLAGLARLESLTVYENQIVDVSPLSGMDRLQYLSLNSNRIQDPSPLAGLEGLESLTLYDNHVTTLASFTAGDIFTAALGTPTLYLSMNPLLPEVCDTQIPALEARGVSVYHDVCTGPAYVPDVTGGALSAARAMRRRWRQSKTAAKIRMQVPTTRMAMSSCQAS